MAAGADFIKTSTGKEPTNATIPVSLVMIRAIRECAAPPPRPTCARAAEVRATRHRNRRRWHAARSVATCLAAAWQMAGSSPVGSRDRTNGRPPVFHTERLFNIILVGWQRTGDSYCGNHLSALLRPGHCEGQGLWIFLRDHTTGLALPRPCPTRTPWPKPAPGLCSCRFSRPLCPRSSRYYHDTGFKVGFKPAGGISQAKQALVCVRRLPRPRARKLGGGAAQHQHQLMQDGQLHKLA